MKYKVGDKVRIRSKEWYESHKNKFGKVWTKDFEGNYSVCFHHELVKYCGKVAEIFSVQQSSYALKGIPYAWTDEMIEGLVEEETKTLTTEKMDKVIEEAKTYWDSIKDAWICPEGYQFVDENGNIINAQKIVLEKKKKEYPKTYEECAEIIAELTGSDCNPKGCMGYMSVQLTALQKLLTCRDAYWKIAGEEMGLGKPWKPDWTAKDNHFYTIHTFNGKIECSATAHRNAVLIFPTEEMRDAFYENFKSEIESCKEFL